MRDRFRTENLARQAPTILLAAAALVSAGLLISYGARLSFISDDWELLVRRHGLSAGLFFEPYAEHILVGPTLVWKLLLGLFGMGSATPFYAVSIATFVLSAILLFAYARSRVGDWLALLAAVLVLFLGAAFEDLLLASQIGYFGSMAAGLGVLLALDRESEDGDRVACALLVVSIAFSSLGLIFVAGAFADLLLGRRPRERRLYIPLLPLALWGLWWAGWGHDAESHLSADNLRGVPSYVFDAAAAGFTSLFGLATGDGSEPDQPHLIWGRLALIGVVILGAVKVARERRVSRGLAVVLVLALALWVVAALNRSPERFPTSSRYQYPSAVFILLVAAELLRGVKVPPPLVVAAAAGTFLAAVGGVSLMNRELTERWEPATDAIRYSLAAVEIAGPSADPAFPVSFPPRVTVSADRYLDAVSDHGSPAFDEAELAGRPPEERLAADLTLASALGLALVSPEPGERVLRCQDLQASAEGGTGVTLLQGGFTLNNRGAAPVEVLLSRFADEFSVDMGPLPAGVETSLTIPADRSDRPWNLGLRGQGPVRLCTTEPG
jgi:hypothetical protein